MIHVSKRNPNDKADLTATRGERMNAMKVIELIALLENLDPEAEIVLKGEDFGGYAYSFGEVIESGYGVRTYYGSDIHNAVILCEGSQIGAVWEEDELNDGDEEDY